MGFNNYSTPGSVEERPGGGARVLVGPNNGPGENGVLGLQSTAAIDWGAVGTTVIFHVTTADVPIYNGSMFGLSARIGVAIRDDGTIGLWAGWLGDVYFNSESQMYDVNELGDGDTIYLSVDSTGWSYRVKGVRHDGTDVADSGSWTDSGWSMPYGYSNLTAESLFAWAWMQGSLTDTTPREMRFSRISILDGVCDPGDVPVLP